MRLDVERVLAALRRSNGEVARLTAEAEERAAADPLIDRALDELEALIERRGCNPHHNAKGKLTSEANCEIHIPCGGGFKKQQAAKAQAHAAAGHKPVPKHVARARRKIDRAHHVQQARNRAEAHRKPVHELPKPEGPDLKYHRDRAKAIDAEDQASRDFLRDNKKKHDEISKKLEQYDAKRWDWSVSERTRKLNDTLARKLKAENQEFLDLYHHHEYMVKSGRERQRQRNAEDLAKQEAIHAAKEAPKYNYAEAHAKHPNLIAPGPIAGRMAAYHAGDVKVREIANLEAPIERIKARQEKAHEHLNRLMQRQADIAAKAFDKSPDAPDYAAHQAKINKAVDRLQARIDRHVEEKLGPLRERRAAMEAEIREHVQHLIGVKDGHEFKATDVPPGFKPAHKDITLEPLTEKTRQGVREAQDWLHSVTAKSDTPAVERMYGERPGQRAYHAWKGDHIALDRGESPGVAVHELGHALDESIVTGGKKLVESSLAFKEHRLKGEKPVSLKEKFQDHGYEDHEIGAKDEFNKAFSESSAYYVGKDYGTRGTEIVSMGVEKLYRDPVGFAKKDPEYAKFILGVLDGSLR